YIPMRAGCRDGGALRPCYRPPHQPRDKAKVETAVLIIEGWILARLRHRRFYSLAELNAAISLLFLSVPLSQDVDRPAIECQKLSASEASDPGRDHPERWAASYRNRGRLPPGIRRSDTPGKQGGE